MKFTILFLAIAICAGCQCGTQQLVAVESASASSCAQAVRPQVAAYSIGPESYVRGTLAIPGEFVTCVGDFLRCGIDALLPRPIPTAVYAGAAPASTAVCGYAPTYVAPAAAPCVEAPVTYVEREVVEMCPETYEEMVPVQRTRMVPRTSIERVPMKMVPAGPAQRSSPCAPAAPAPAAAPCVPSGSSSDPLASCAPACICDPATGCCVIPAGR